MLSFAKFKAWVTMRMGVERYFVQSEGWSLNLRALKMQSDGNRKSRWAVCVFIVVSVVALYALSIGPAQYLAVKISLNGDWTERHQAVWEMFYYPHMRAMEGGGIVADLLVGYCTLFSDMAD